MIAFLRGLSKAVRAGEVKKTWIANHLLLPYLRFLAGVVGTLQMIWFGLDVIADHPGWIRVQIVHEEREMSA